MKHRIKNIHFVGIGGAGMSGIAEVLLNLGYVVSGSDLAATQVTQRLERLGARVAYGHDAAHVASAHVVVTSTAVTPGNPEVQAARAAGIPVVPRAVMLAELMRLKRGIAVAGTHGKTTTTSLVASVLAAGGLDPTFVIGGKLNSADANARLGQGEYIVVEADESDASFLNLLPVMAIVTNIDADHMETYGHDIARLKRAFVEFIQRLPFYGSAILCLDDACVREIMPFVSRPITTYGMHPEAKVRAVNVRPDGTRMRFTVECSHIALAPFDVVLDMPGRHNVCNALAAIAVGLELGVSVEHICTALAEFKGVGRRFARHEGLNIDPCRGGGTYTLIDDYGHHPAEMHATLAAVRGAYPDRRVVLAFQPHRYTRTRDCFHDFVRVLGEADEVVITEVYPAGEAPIAGADGLSLARAVENAGQVRAGFVESVAQLPETLERLVRDGDVVVLMGAGSIGGIPAELKRLAARFASRSAETTVPAGVAASGLGV